MAVVQASAAPTEYVAVSMAGASGNLVYTDNVDNYIDRISAQIRTHLLALTGCAALALLVVCVVYIAASQIAGLLGPWLRARRSERARQPNPDAQDDADERAVADDDDEDEPVLSEGPLIRARLAALRARHAEYNRAQRANSEIAGRDEAENVIDERVLSRAHDDYSKW